MTITGIRSVFLLPACSRTRSRKLLGDCDRLLKVRLRQQQTVLNWIPEKFRRKLKTNEEESRIRIRIRQSTRSKTVTPVCKDLLFHFY